MNIANSASVNMAASMSSQQKVGDSVGIKVLNKAMDIQAQGAVKLLQSVPEPPKPNFNGTMMGNNIDAKA